MRAKVVKNDNHINTIKQTLAIDKQKGKA